MECQALGAVKGQMALVADDGSLAELIVVRAWCGLVPVAGPASSAFARMVGRIVRVVAAVALGAPITSVGEASEGGAPLIMMLTLENDDGVRRIWTSKIHEKWMLPRQHL